MKTKYLFLLCGSIAVGALTHSAWALNYSGKITPSEVTYNLTSISLGSENNTSTTLVSTPFSVTFKRSDADFAAAKLKDLTVPSGRYIYLSVCVDSTAQITADGVAYHGPTGSGLTNGTKYYTSSADNSSGNLVSSAPGGGAVATTIAPQPGCIMNYFASPICVTDSSKSGCKTGDYMFTSEGLISPVVPDGQSAVTFQIHLMLDLFNSVVVDNTTSQITSLANFGVVVGRPGAAIHMSSSSTSGVSDVSMLFGPDKSLLATYVSGHPGGSTGTWGNNFSHLCQGSNNAAITAAPASAPVSSGIVFFGIFDQTANSGKGTLQVPATSSCMSASTCNSNGVNVLDNFLQPVNNNAIGKCIADSAATPAYLGYTYTGGSGNNASGTDTLPIVRVVDPGNLFNICTSAFVSGHTGSCAASSLESDGYN